MKILKVLLFLLVIVAIGLWVAVKLFQQSIQPTVAIEDTAMRQFTATRLLDRPIIYTNMHPRLQAEAKEYGYANINGPTLMRVPKWVSNPLGNYYLYFAHHKGQFIRLAYADSLQGPWTMYDGEILPLAQSGTSTVESPAVGINTLKKYMSWSEASALMKIGGDAKKAWEERIQQQMKSSPPTTPHVASPEVLIDEASKKIRLYYHGVAEGNLQMSKVATSIDGLQFTPESTYITTPYLRVFPYRDDYYGLAMPGFMYRSTDGLSNFQVRNRWFFDTAVRHSGLYLEGDNLYIFYSRVGDEPERILYTTIDMSSSDWNDWQVSDSKELLRPTLAWEGVNEPVVPSMRGEMGIMVNQLRDPYVFKDVDGQLYLLYTGAGEQGIGIAKLE